MKSFLRFNLFNLIVALGLIIICWFGRSFLLTYNISFSSSINFILLHFFITSISGNLLIYATKKSPTQSVTIFMLSLVAKILIYLFLLIIYSSTNSEINNYLVIFFMTTYFVFLIFEKTYIILSIKS